MKHTKKQKINEGTLSLIIINIIVRFQQIVTLQGIFQTNIFLRF